MQLEIKGKNLDVSDAIRTYTERKLAKLNKLMHDEAWVEVELAVEKNPSRADNQVAEATIGLKGHVLHARESSADMKASIDALTHKLLRQVRETREKQESKRRTPDKHLNGDAAPAESVESVESPLESED
jgi:putative sigma-54 modulation protein